MKDPVQRLRGAGLPSHLAASRSQALAALLTARPAKLRSPLQQRMLQLASQGECIGCTRQGVPLDEWGEELPLQYERSGYAAPALYCDCPRGEAYAREVAERRRLYLAERLSEQRHLYLRLFGSSCIPPPLVREWTLASWPARFPQPAGMEDEVFAELVKIRRQVRSCVEQYAEALTLWDEDRFKRGFCLLGAPGVGKTGLAQSLSPRLEGRGCSLLSLYAPELLAVLRSGWEYQEQTEQLMTVAKTVDVLLLDDIGDPLSADPARERVRACLSRIFDERLKYERHTIITTNLSEDQLEDQLGDYLVSRLHGLCRFFEVPGVDLR